MSRIPASAVGAIAENNNENSFDSNPYAYPYFHAGGRPPPLYQLVDAAFGGADSIEAAVAGPNGRRSARGDAARARIVRRIRSRCVVRPAEAGWSDSCGENALHRLCQAARFGRPGGGGGGGGGASLVGRLLGQGRTTRDEMAVAIAGFLVEADPECPAARNSWREMPLHQFVTHCGIAGGGDHSDREAAANAPPAPTRSPALELLRLLQDACPASTSAKNYMQGLPLHEACSLSQAPESMSHDVMSDFARSVQDIQRRDESQRWMRERHLAVVQHLIDTQPDGLFSLDKMTRTPLLRAVQSDKCSTAVVRLLLERIETHCFHMGVDSEEVPRIIRNTLLGRPSAKEASTVGQAVWCDSNALTDPHHSALDLLWDELVWTPRHVSAPIPWMGAASRATLSSVITAGLQQGISAADIVARLGPLWGKAVLLIRAAAHGSVRDPPPDGRRFRLVHAAVGLLCPRCFVELAVRLHSDRLLDGDEEARTPLAVVASRPPARKRLRDELGHATRAYIPTYRLQEDDGSNGRDLIRLLLRANARSARLADRDGRLPLHLAIASGNMWSDGVKDIFEATPQAVRARDPLTRLFPFMLAAVTETENDGHGRGTKMHLKSEVHSDLQKMRTIFELLKADPSALVC